MKIRKSERPDMEMVLSQPGDMDDVVAAAFETAVDLAMARDWYIVAVRDNGQVYLFGPYESEAVAKRATNGLVSAGPGQAEAQIRKLYKVQETL